VEGRKAGANATQKAIQPPKIGEFIGEMKAELAKVTWTSQEEMKVYVQVVLGATLVFGFGIYAVDLVIQSVLQGLGVIVRFLGG